MDRTIETQIIDAEERLRLAMLTADVSGLDELLAPELIAIGHLGDVCLCYILHGCHVFVDK